MSLLTPERCYLLSILQPFRLIGNFEEILLITRQLFYITYKEMSQEVSIFYTLRREVILLVCPELIGLYEGVLLGTKYAPSPDYIFYESSPN